MQDLGSSEKMAQTYYLHVLVISIPNLSRILSLCASRRNEIQGYTWRNVGKKNIYSLKSSMFKHKHQFKDIPVLYKSQSRCPI